MAGFLRCLRQLAPVVCSSAKLSLRAPINYRVLLWHGCRDSWILPTLPTRHLATKKAKAKGKGQARVNINISLVEDIINLEEVNEDMQAVVTDLQEEFNKTLNIRTSPGAFHHITVVTSSGKFPLNELAQITLKSPQLMLVNMSNFPESTAAAVKAIQESGMNLNPEADGAIIRVPVPKVTREHRENLVVVAKQVTNKAKEALRKIRTRAVNQTRKAKGTASVSEDTLKLIEKQIQQMTDDVTAELEKLLAAKTKELLG
ncbi:ribosome-recycling factor, mitochondrial isoform X1 [Pogona vitticeps]